MAAKIRIVQTFEQALAALSDRIRRLEIPEKLAGNWSLVEDQGNGNLLAVRYNGQGVAKTIVSLAAMTPALATLTIGDYVISQSGVNLVATNTLTTTVTVVAVP